MSKPDPIFAGYERLDRENARLRGALKTLMMHAESYVNLSRVQGESLRSEASDAVRNALAAARAALNLAGEA